MSGGLNNDLIEHTETFLRRYLIMSQSHTFLTRKSDGKLGLASGLYDVDLAPANNEPRPSVYLRPRAQWGSRSHKLGCYFLSGAPNQINLETMPAGNEWFFTDLLTGCQFLAYGRADAPSLEHNNKIEDGSVDYGARLANARRGDLLAQVSPGTQYNPTGGEYGSVVGRRTRGGWDFWFQRVAADKKLHLVKLPSP